MTSRSATFPLILATVCLVYSSLFAVAATPASARQKPVKTTVDRRYDPHRISVRFRDGLDIRLRGNKLVSTNQALFAQSSALFASLAAGRWRRADSISEDKLDQLRHTAEQRLGRALPDLNLQFYLTLPASMDAGTVIDALNQLAMVDLAKPVLRPAPPPSPRNYESLERDHFPAPTGVGAFNVWTNNNTLGAGLQLCDAEYSFNSNHLDLPSIENLDFTAVDPFNDDNHGTAVAGELCAQENGFGTTGLAPAATYYFVGANYPDGYDLGQGITTALTVLRPGDVLLIEQQTWGPRSTEEVEDSGGQYGSVPSEWDETTYDRIVTAVGNGIIVVEAAGNGGQNLDDPIYSTGNGGHYPFLPQNNSGAIIVGAGASYNGSSKESSPLDFTDYGSRVDVQGIGENMYSTGYGDLYSAEGINLYYTDSFGGTSSASPVVAGSVLLLQSAYNNVTGTVLSPSTITALLRNTGSPEQSGAYTGFDWIGPLPNVPAAIAAALADSGPPQIIRQTTNFTALANGVAILTVAASGEGPLSYQWQFDGTNLSDGTNIFGSGTADLSLTGLNFDEAGSYSVLISNSLGQIASSTAVLSVVADPSVSPGVTLSNVYIFSGTDGSGAVGVTTDEEGNLFGVTEYGGAYGYGAIYEIETNGAFDSLYSFADDTDGAYPMVGLIEGGDGNFYGTTQYGGETADGNYGSGTVFSISPDGFFNTLYTFTGGDDGGLPQSSLVEGSPGVFYGTTYSGGAGSNGVIFSVDAAGDFNPVYSFSGPDGSTPYGGLVLGTDGNLYGTADSGGAYGQGTVYGISLTGNFTNLFSFNGANGSLPSANLIEGADGNFYGRTYYGGSHDDGAVFRISSTGVFSNLFSFSGTNGVYPYSSLVQGPDGNFYGTTSQGGTNDQDGLIYEVSPAGAGSVVARFNGPNGVGPFAALTPAGDGSFYGTTFDGGYGYGVVFRVSFSGAQSPIFQSVSQSAGNVTLNVSVVPGRAYQLQYTTSLTQPEWIDLGAPQTATNPVLQFSDVLPKSGQRFYRAFLLEP